VAVVLYRFIATASRSVGAADLAGPHSAFTTLPDTISSSVRASQYMCISWPPLADCDGCNMKTCPQQLLSH